MIQRSRLRDQLGDELRERIVDGRLGAGQTIREPPLAAELGVSRTPLREALLELEREGLLTSDVGRGFSVAPLTATDVLQMYPILAELHGLALHLGGAPDKRALRELREINRSIEASVGKPRRLFDLDRRFHDRLLAACDNAELLALIDTYNTRSRRYDMAYWREYGDATVSVAEHDSILDALGERSPARARKRLVSHWMSCIPRLEAWLNDETGE